MGCMKKNSREGKALRFCTVAYIENGGILETLIEDIILIAVELPSCSGIQVKKRRDWHDMVRQEDREFVISILTDIAQRTSSDPQVVFGQISNLGVGPLVTHSTGPDLNAREELLAVYLEFENIS